MNNEKRCVVVVGRAADGIKVEIVRTHRNQYEIRKAGMKSVAYSGKRVDDGVAKFMSLTEEAEEGAFAKQSSSVKTALISPASRAN